MPQRRRQAPADKHDRQKNGPDNCSLPTGKEHILPPHLRPGVHGLDGGVHFRPPRLDFLVICSPRFARSSLSRASSSSISASVGALVSNSEATSATPLP